MLKITIQDNDGAKIYFSEGIQFNQTKVKGLPYNELVLFMKSGKVKSNMFLLHPGDIVLVEESIDE